MRGWNRCDTLGGHKTWITITTERNTLLTVQLHQLQREDYIEKQCDSTTVKSKLFL